MASWGPHSKRPPDGQKDADGYTYRGRFRCRDVPTPVVVPAGVPTSVPTGLPAGIYASVPAAASPWSMTSASSSYSDPAVTVKSSSPGGSSTRAGAPALDQTAEQTEQAEQGDDSSTASSIVPASDFTYSAPPSEVSEYDNDLRSLPGRAEKEAMRKGKERPSRRAQDSASSLSGSPCEDDGSQENDRGVGEGEKIEVSARNEPGDTRAR